jgi:hypothetical protein
MRRTTAPLPVAAQVRHSQPISAAKATSSTINVSSGTIVKLGHLGGSDDKVLSNLITCS